MWVLPDGRHPHALRRRGARRPGARGVGEARRHHEFLGSCSLSTVHVGGVDAGDLFGRVEAIPRRHVIHAVEEQQDLVDRRRVRRRAGVPAARPNLAAFIGALRHADRDHGAGPGDPQGGHPDPGRAGTDGGDAREALDAGFVGMSAQQLLFDKLDGEVCRSRTLPSTYAQAAAR